MAATRKLWVSGMVLASAAFAPALLLVFAEWFTLHVNSSPATLLEMGVLLWLSLYFIIGCLGVALVCFPKSRAIGGGVLFLLAVSFLAAWGGRWVAGEMRVSEMSRLAARSAPVTAAIHSFERDSGRPPQTLQDLVPRYLDSEPRTGLGGYPLYAYKVAENSVWTLKVETPTAGIFNQDHLKYAPNRSAGKVGYSVRRHEDWIYVEVWD